MQLGNYTEDWSALYEGNNDYSTCKIFLTILLRTVPLIQSKWQIIGKALKLTDKTLNRISEETCPCHRNLEVTHCCVKMLKEVLTENKGITINEFLNATKIPFIGLNNVSPLIEKHLKNPDWLASTTNTSNTKALSVKGPKRPPTESERKYFQMLGKVIEHLNNSEVTVSLLLNMLEQYGCLDDEFPPEVYQNVKSFSELITSLRKHQYISNLDLSWLKFLVKENCPEAFEVIEKYENTSLAEKIVWTDQPKYAHRNGTHVVGVTDFNPECVTVGDMTAAKDVIADVVGLKPTDIITESAGISSVHFHWRVRFRLHSIAELLSEVTYDMMIRCKRAHITHIGILSKQKCKIIDVRYQGMYVCMDIYNLCCFVLSIVNLSA